MPELAYRLAPLDHPAFRVGKLLPQAEPLYEKQLSDGHRLGVLFQLACVLAHANLRGLTVDDVDQDRPLANSMLDRRYRLCGLSLGHARARGSTKTQTLLKRVALGLFEAQSKVAGRGQARKAMRTLVAGWEEQFMEQAAAGQVNRILGAAPFLWERRYRWHRAGMAAVHRRDVDANGSRSIAEPTYLWVVGGAAFRERTLRRAATVQPLTDLLISDKAVDLWRGHTLETPSKAALAPSDLVEIGRWGAALARWRKRPPEIQVEKLAMAECLFCLGRVDESMEMVQETGDHRADSKGRFNLRWALLWARCAAQLGQLQVAAKAVKQLTTRQVDWGRFSVEERYLLFDVAIRTAANQRDQEQLRATRTLALQMRGQARSWGLLSAAMACLDLDDLSGAVRYLEESVAVDPDIGEHWRYHVTLGEVQLAAQNETGALQTLASALAVGRRKMTKVEACKVWSSMVLARAMSNDLAGAERACRHALLLSRKCDGLTGSTLILATMLRFGFGAVG